MLDNAEGRDQTSRRRASLDRYLVREGAAIEVQTKQCRTRDERRRTDLRRRRYEELRSWADKHATT